MRHFLSTITLLVCLAVPAFAQNYITVDTDSIGDETDGRHAEHLLIINVTNTDTVDRVLIWDRVEEVIPSSWTGTQMCENGICHFYTVSTDTMLLKPGVASPLEFHFANDSAIGDAYVKIHLYVERDSVRTAQDVVFTMTAFRDITSVNSVSIGKPDIQVYPNPAKDYLLVKRGVNDDVERIEVYNMLGIKVLSQAAGIDGLTTRVDLVDLSKGVYMVRVFDGDNNVLMTRAVSKTR